MSIARHEIRANHILELLKFDDAKLQSLNPRLEIETCLAAHKEIWEHPDIDFYTRHDLLHSEHIIAYFAKLDRVYGWSEYEKLVFVIAALIHDIGMQYNQWSKYPVTDGVHKSIAELIGEPLHLTPNQVRKEHITLGQKLIEYEYRTRRVWDKPDRFSTQRGTNLLGHASQVAFAHSDGQLWEQFKVPTRAEYKRKQMQDGGVLRLRLLAGVLRLCDELDGDYTRVTDPSEMWRVSNTSRLHWLACLYTHEIQLQVGDDPRQIDVLLQWRLPYDDDVEVRSDILRLLDKMRHQRMQATVDEVNSMYKSGDEREFMIEPRIRFAEVATDRFKQPLTSELRSLLREQDTILDVRKSVVVHAKQDVTPDNERRNSSPSPETSGTPDKVLATAMQEWLLRHSQPGHIRLYRQAHTDTLVHMRELVSDAGMCSGISDAIAHLVKDERPRLLIGVGTAAIPIVTQLQMELKVHGTFTVHHLEEPNGRHWNTWPQQYFEWSPVLESSGAGRIVVIDDLVAQGVSSSRLIQHLIQRGVSPEEILYVAMFRLSSVDMIRHEGVKYVALCEVGNIYYAPPNSFCLHCELYGEPIDEWKKWPGGWLRS
jgi:orotate phosphoribosyltransferase